MLLVFGLPFRYEHLIFSKVHLLSGLKLIVKLKMNTIEVLLFACGVQNLTGTSVYGGHNLPHPVRIGLRWLPKLGVD